MKNKVMSRRTFIKTTSTGAIAASQLVPAYAFTIQDKAQSGKVPHNSVMGLYVL